MCNCLVLGQVLVLKTVGERETSSETSAFRYGRSSCRCGLAQSELVRADDDMYLPGVAGVGPPPSMWYVNFDVFGSPNPPPDLWEVGSQDLVQG